MEWIRVHANEEVLPPRRWALLFKLKMWGVVWLSRPKERHPSAHLGGPWADRCWSKEGGEGFGPGGRSWAWIQPRLNAGIRVVEKWGSRAEPTPTSDMHMGTDKWNFRGPTGAAELRPGGRAGRQDLGTVTSEKYSQEDRLPCNFQRNIFKCSFSDYRAPSYNVPLRFILKAKSTHSVVSKTNGKQKSSR